MPRRVARTFRSAAVVLALVLVLGACGGGSGGGTGGATATPAPTRTLNGEAPVVTLKLDMRDIAYSAEELRAPAGSVFAIEFRNRGVIEHDFTIETFAGQASGEAGGDPAQYDVHVLLDRGEEATLLLKAPGPGSIVFWCTIAGHREVGMEGVLVIE